MAMTVMPSIHEPGFQSFSDLIACPSKNGKKCPSNLKPNFLSWTQEIFIRLFVVSQSGCNKHQFLGWQTLSNVCFPLHWYFAFRNWDVIIFGNWRLNLILLGKIHKQACHHKVILLEERNFLGVLKGIMRVTHWGTFSDLALNYNSNFKHFIFYIFHIFKGIWGNFVWLSFWF